MLVVERIGDDDIGARSEAPSDDVRADRLVAGKHCREFDGVALQFSVLLHDVGDHGGSHGGADVIAQLGVFEQLAVEQLSTADGDPSGGGEGGNAQSHHSTRPRSGGQVPAGTQSSLGGGSDIASQGRVDAAGNEIDVAGDADERFGELSGLLRWQVPGVGIEYDGVVVVEEVIEVDLRGLARPGHGDGPQPRLGEEGSAGVAAGEVVGDDEDPWAVLAHTIKSSTNSSGMEPAHTAVVMPDQPLMAFMPSRPVKRVTTQKYESLK